MKVRRNWRIALAFAIAVLSLPGSALADSADNSFANDPSITLKYLPGKYYEQQAQQAVKRGDFRQALEMYEKAGSWGNKIAQYDVAGNEGRLFRAGE